MALTEYEKVRIRHHLGYLGVTDAYTFVLGTPAAVETQFLIEGAMDRVMEEALPLARELLARCDLTESQMIDDQELIAVDEIGEIKLRKTQQKELRKVYREHIRALSNLLGVPQNPFDKRGFGVGGAGGTNIPVM